MTSCDEENSKKVEHFNNATKDNFKEGNEEVGDLREINGAGCYGNNDVEDSDYDTDIEDETGTKEDEFDPTGRNRYLRKCEELNIVPVSNFVANLVNTTCDLTHHNVGPKGAQAISTALIQNIHVTKLRMRANAIQSEGTIFVGALLRENYNLTEVDLSENEIGHVGAHTVARALAENNALRALHLAENGLKDKDAKLLAEALKHNSSLWHFDLSRNALGEEAGLALGPAIDINTGLKTLDLSWNHLRGRGAVAVAKGLGANCGLRTLLLAWNGFGDDGACAVANALRANDSLEELDISNNRISVKGCFELAGGLKVNTTLKTLKIGRNPFGSKGAHALLMAIKANQSSRVENLDLEGVVIDQDSQEVLAQLLKDNTNLKLSCEFSQSGGQFAKDLEGYFSRRRFGSKFDAEYMIGVLKQYVKDNNLRLIDLFNQLDKDKNKSVSREELIRGFHSIKVPLSDKQLDCFMEQLDTDGNGEIDYSEFTWLYDVE